MDEATKSSHLSLKLFFFACLRGRVLVRSRFFFLLIALLSLAS